MASFEDIAKLIPIDQVASQLGVDPSTAQASVMQALPALLAGFNKNAQTAEGAQALQNAVTEHPPQLVDGGVDVAQVDVADGEKIVGHAFGGDQDQVVAALADQPGSGGSDVFQKLLPLIAPVVLSYLSKQMSGAGQQQAQEAPAPAPAPQAGGGLDIGGLLGGLLGGGGGGATGSAGSGGGGLDIGGLIGGLLGGNR